MRVIGIIHPLPGEFRNHVAIEQGDQGEQNYGL